MAIVIAVQNPGLASEIGSLLRREGRLSKTCPSLCGPEFLKEFPKVDLIITDTAPPVLRFITVAGRGLLSADAPPLLVVASKGHCASFASMLRPGTDQCIPLEVGPEFLEKIRQVVCTLNVATDNSAPPVADLLGSAKRIGADRPHEHRLDRYSRKAMNRQIQFVSDIVHDLRTPLTAIGEFAELMRTGLSGDMNEQQRRYVGIIERCCGEAARMVFDLLDGAKLQSGHIHPHRQAVELRSVFAEVFDSLEPAILHSGITLEMESADSLPRVFGDRDMLGRILGNLVSNAIKFSPSRSTVIMRSERFSMTMARVSVIDTGSGISPSDLRRIFHRFEQGTNQSNGGVGLGLAIVRELVKLHGGRVTVESAPGRGSKFHFTIPLYLPTAIVRRHQAQIAKSPGNPTTAWVFTYHDPSKYDAVHRLISATVRARDLVLPDDDRSHLLLITQSRQPQRLIERLRIQVASYGGLTPSVHELDLSLLNNWVTNTANRTARAPESSQSAPLAG